MKQKVAQSCEDYAAHTECFNTLVYTHLQTIKSSCKTNKNDRRFFEEDWQDVLIALWEHATECPPDDALTWALAIAKHEMILAHRRRKFARTSGKSSELNEEELCSTYYIPSENAVSSDFWQLENDVSCGKLQKVARCLAGFPEEWRKIVLFHADGYSVRDISMALNVANSTVKYRLRRALEILRAQCATKS